MDTEPRVEAYLNTQDFSTCKYDFAHPQHVEAIKGGTTNYTYRLLYSPEKGQRSVVSAVLKFAAEYATNDPFTPFSSERQRYEAHAMRELADALNAQYEGEECIVRAPELYYYDDASHVMIMEDISPPPSLSASGAGPLYISLENMCQSPVGENALELMRLLGDQLGRYLYRLHSLTRGASEPASRDLRVLFLPNSMSKEIDVQTCFRDVPAKLAQYGIRLSADDHAKLADIIADLDKDYMNTPESVIMGDTLYAPHLRLPAPCFSKMNVLMKVPVFT